MIREIVRQCALVLGLALAPALVSGFIQLRPTHNEPLQAGEVRAATARLWGNQVVFVDTRTRAQFESRHIPGAILLNNQEWQTQAPVLLASWSDGKVFVVYGEDDDQAVSEAIAARMRDELKLAPRTVSVLKGGWRAWRR